MRLKKDIKVQTGNSREFRNFVESFYFFLLENIAETLPVPGRLNDVYRGDFFGMLKELNIQERYWYIVATVNRVRSSGGFAGDLDVIKVPSTDSMDRVIKGFITKRAL